MYILGYSGLDGYVEYKSSNIDNLNDREKLVAQGMDSSAALMKDGKIIAAAAEERFTGSKHTGKFPINAIEFCLKKANIKMDDIDLVVHNFNYVPYEQFFVKNDYDRKLFNNILSDKSQEDLFWQNFGNVISGKFTGYNHHDCHAAYAFETSGFKDSLVIVADGIGEFDSLTIYNADRDKGLLRLASFGPVSSLGMLYSAVTDYLGFFMNSDEYKIMGLAAYGNPKTYERLFDEIIELKDDGSVIVSHLFPDKVSSPSDKETYHFFKEWLSGKIFKERLPSEVVEKCHKDFAAALQKKLNDSMAHIVKYWKKQTGCKNLCLSGGVALNCVANAYIANLNIFEGLYVPPAAADDGTSVGACLMAMRLNCIKLDTQNILDMPFYGPSIEAPTKDMLVRNKLKMQKLDDKYLVSKITDSILDGKIIAWSMGEMEFGPRALGHRSILANPKNYEIRKRLNSVTKQREDFRPFAPIVKEEALGVIFEINKGVIYKHMLINARVKDEFRDRLQAITHIDGTARVQSVSKKDLPLLWLLLDEVEAKTGLPVLLNTSFNLKSMPIVCSVEEAVDSFANSDIDILVVNNYLVQKNNRC